MSLQLFRPFYALLWVIGLPVVLVYLWRRGRRDPLYALHLAERFGRVSPRIAPGALWVHAVSLGELRAASPLIRALLDRGEGVIVTTFTPAGRREGERLFGAEIAAGRLHLTWQPFDAAFALRPFLRRLRPRACLMVEIDYWPGMILECGRAGVPVMPANAQYPAATFARDGARRRWRMQAIGACDAALAKSTLHAARFRQAGVAWVEVTGEWRFDLPRPEAQIAAGRAARGWFAPGRGPVVVLASSVAGEDATYLAAFAALREALARRGHPLRVVWVPRRPERFDAVAGMAAAAGFTVVRRSAVLGPEFAPLGPSPGAEVLLGDSLGEMFAYLAMADRAVVGGGFVPAGAHNIIEPLSLGLPVLTGPATWTNEYPQTEAEAAGVARAVPDAAALAAALADPVPAPPGAIAAFLADHAGATARTLAALDRIAPPPGVRPS